jgi:hypothetical protein
MTTRDRHSEADEGLRHINPITGHLLMIFGPADADGADNPLTGTQYDPVVRQHHDAERRHERWARQEQRHRSHLQRRRSRRIEPEGPSEHSTPDEV